MGCLGWVLVPTHHCSELLEMLQCVPLHGSAALGQVLSPLELGDLAAGGQGRGGTRKLDWRGLTCTCEIW